MRVAAIYARVSTPGQQEDGTSLETQVAACLESAQELGDSVPPEYILQEQASGSDTNRPLLAKLRQLVRDRKIDVIIIYHPDRLSRDATDLMMLWQEITEQGVEIRLLQGPAGTSPEDKLLRFIFGYKSEAERRDILERTMRGKKKTAEIGRLPVGSGLGLFGYRYEWSSDGSSSKPKLLGRTILPDEASVVRQIFDLCISGICDYEIARRLNQQGIPTKGGSKWHPLTVRRMLTNTAYKGVTYYGKERVEKIRNSTKRLRTATDPSEWVLVEGFTPPIMSEAHFELAQQRLKEDRKYSINWPGATRTAEPFI